SRRWLRALSSPVRLWYWWARRGRRPWCRWMEAGSELSTLRSSAWRSRTAAISGVAWTRNCGGAGWYVLVMSLHGEGDADGDDAGRRRPPAQIGRAHV